MTASVATTIDPRKLLVSGGIPDQRGDGRPRLTAVPSAVETQHHAPPAQPAEDSPSAWEDWRAEVLGATWMRVP